MKLLSSCPCHPGGCALLGEKGWRSQVTDMRMPILADNRVLLPNETALALKLVTRTELLRLKAMAHLHARGVRERHDGYSPGAPGSAGPKPGKLANPYLAQEFKTFRRTASGQPFSKLPFRGRSPAAYRSARRQL